MGRDPIEPCEPYFGCGPRAVMCRRSAAPSDSRRFSMRSFFRRLSSSRLSVCLCDATIDLRIACSRGGAASENCAENCENCARICRIARSSARLLERLRGVGIHVNERRLLIDELLKRLGDHAELLARLYGDGMRVRELRKRLRRIAPELRGAPSPTTSSSAPESRSSTPSL